LINTIKDAAMTQEQVFVLVYAKGPRIKVLGIEDSVKYDKELREDGWKHTHTLDACMYLQFLHNKCENIEEEVMALKKVTGICRDTR
jgi:hypothetical protein